MGSTMKPTIFNDRVAKAVKKWHHTARNHVRHNNKDASHSGANTPFSSLPATPTHGMSPVHLLHKHTGHSDSPLASPRASSSIYENEKWDVGGSTSPSNHARRDHEKTLQMQVVEPSSTELPPIRAQHEITMSLSEFEFDKPHNGRD